MRGSSQDARPMEVEIANTLRFTAGQRPLPGNVSSAAAGARWDHSGICCYESWGLIWNRAIGATRDGRIVSTTKSFNSQRVETEYARCRAMCSDVLGTVSGDSAGE